jgi:hypothetical protein
MRKYAVLVLINLGLVFPFSGLAQNPVSAPPPSSLNQIEQNPAERGRSGENSNSVHRNFFPFKAKRTKDQEKRLLPNPADLAKYSDFLHQPKTGIFRLMNDAGCESNVYVIRVDEPCKSAIPGGSFYSFREKDYTTAYLSDLRFKDGILVSDGILSQNILVRLGDVSLENLSLESEGIKYLTEFVPEKLSSEATKQYIQIVKGVKANRHEYRKALPAHENMTYAIRVIAYRGSIYRNFRGWIYNLLDGDKRIDIIVGFRVIRKEADGSVTLLWKELDRKKSPKLERDKKKKENVKPLPNISNREVAGS